MATTADRHAIRSSDPQPQPADRADPSIHNEETYSHFLARETQIVLRWVIFISAGLTVFLMFTFFYFAILPAAVMLIAFALLLIADFVEYRTHQPGDPGYEEAALGAEAHALEPTELQRDRAARERIAQLVHMRLRRTVLGIIASVAIAALAVAAWHFGRNPQLQPLIGIAAMVLFAYMLFIAAPFWLGWIGDKAEEEQHHVEEELHEEEDVRSNAVHH